MGAYHDVIQLSSAAGNVDVNVALFVAASGSILGVDITGVTFQGQQSNRYSHPQTIKVLNLGDPGTVANWAADVPYGGTLVSPSPASGTATPATPGILTLDAQRECGIPGSRRLLRIGSHLGCAFAEFAAIRGSRARSGEQFRGGGAGSNATWTVLYRIRRRRRGGSPRGESKRQQYLAVPSGDIDHRRRQLAERKSHGVVLPGQLRFR